MKNRIQVALKRAFVALQDLAVTVTVLKSGGDTFDLSTGTVTQSTEQLTTKAVFTKRKKTADGISASVMIRTLEVGNVAIGDSITNGSEKWLVNSIVTADDFLIVAKVSSYE